MSNGTQGPIYSATDGGVIGIHPVPDPLQLPVGPATSDELNTARLRLLPIACFRLDNPSFHFDSSFVLARAQTEMKAFAALRKSDPRFALSPISIFGHADPSFEGNFEPGSRTAQVGDDYNKNLSGRRAIAIYALLVRDVSLWDHLFTNHLGRDVWGEDSIRTMLDLTDPVNRGQQAPSGPDGSNSGAADSARNAKVRDIANDSGQRQQLFLTYMNLLCGDLKLDKSTDFLARNAGPDHKGDVQGCSRFNPDVLFKSEDEARFKQAFSDKDETTLRGERDVRNAINRRVMILVFRKGSQVLPSKWPCPTFREGSASCKKRFFSDGDTRRSTHLSGAERKFDLTHDTFACRFFQRVSDGSPCHSILSSFEIRLYDTGRRFIANAPFEVTIGSSAPRQGIADPKGVLVLRDISIPNTCLIKWGFPDGTKDELPGLIFTLNMFLSVDAEQQQEEARKKLNNLGYIDPDLAINVEDFQADYADATQPPLELTGELDSQTLELIRQVYKDCADKLDQPVEN
jgi:hypothetical protein